MKFNLLFLVILLVSSCSSIEPRKPLNPKVSTTLLQETVALSKAINKNEENKILALIKKDSLTAYKTASNGFWYTYITKITESLPTPEPGQEVTFTYTISTLNNTIIYSEEELGVKKYKVDKEDFITAIQKGIKLMKVGETVTFVIPSYNAFGVVGDGNKIGNNQSIKSTVTLININ